jgi:hypothetical protein
MALTVDVKAEASADATNRDSTPTLFTTLFTIITALRLLHTTWNTNPATIEMPSIPYPRIFPRTPDVDQSSLSQISGFYGPGQWAAGVLALASSLFALRRDPDNAMLNFIPPILFINWAAVDLLKQLNAESFSYELIASASGVTLWGIWYLTCVQMLLNLYDDDGVLESKRRPMRFMAVLGFIVPFIALDAIVLHASGKGSSWIDLPLFILNMGFCGRTHVAAACDVAFSRKRRISPKIPTSSYILRSVGIISVCKKAFDFVESILEHAASLQDGAGDRPKCMVKPCAPQNITESDQGFALCCGLVLFAYEIGPHVLRPTRKLEGPGLVVLAYVKSGWVLLRTRFQGKGKLQKPGRQS